MDLALLGITVEPVGLIVTLVIGAVCGYLAGMLMKGGSLGLVPNIVVGILGALVFGFLFTNFSMVNPLVDQIIGGTVGAMVLLFVLSLFPKFTAT